MKINNFLILGVLMIAFQINSIAQGKLLYLNGKERRFSSAEVKGEFIIYKPEGDQKIRKADKYNVFSIVRDNGSEEIIYTPDTINEMDPPVEDARQYIKGEQHAMEVYKKPTNLIGGIAAGLAGSAAGFYGIPAPLIYTTIVGQFSPKLPKAERSLNYPEPFIAGYQRKARNIKIKNSLIGGTIGFGVGITALILILGND